MDLENKSFWRKVLFTSWLTAFVIGMIVGRMTGGF